jgi:iron complex outermembrane receptor protein
MALLLSASSLSFTRPIHAETLTEEHTRAADTAIEEVIVTSRKRQESLQGIPESVTAFNAQAVADARIETIADAIGMTPGVTLIRDEQPGSSTIAIRGVSQNRSGEPPIAFVIDGVPLGNPYEFMQDLFDIERIEVLKGPQGSLYGRNAIGGAINITTRAPGEEIEGRASVRVARGNELKVGGSLGGPLVRDRIYFRVAGTYHNTDGLIPNITVGRKVDDFHDRSARARLVLTPSESLRIDLTGFYNRYHGGGGWWAPGNLTPLGWNTVRNDPQGDVLGRATKDQKSASAKIDYDFGALTLTSITGLGNFDQTLYQDFDMTPVSVLEGFVREEFETLTQEFRITSNGTGRLRWLAGAFFQDTTRERQTDVFLNLGAPPPISAGTGDPAAKTLAQIADIPSKREYEAYAAFGQADYLMTDRLTATLGLRYDTEKRSQVIPTGLPDVDFSSLQPKVSLAFQAKPGLLTYVTVAKGYRPGGFNDAAGFAATFDKESLWSYEVGVKSSMWNERATINAAVYYERFDNQQFFIVDGSGQQAIINGEKTGILGAEIEFHARPVSSFQVSGGLGYNDTEIKNFGEFPGAAFDTAAFSGNRIPQVPKYNMSVGLQHTYPIGKQLRLQSRLDVRREGRIYWHPDNVSSRGAFTLADLRVSLDRDDWRISLYGENIFDERYISSQFDNAWTGLLSGADIVWTPAPRSYGIEASINF